MSRMLFLRDIQVDIQMRCRDCGHEGVLARLELERRFGPNYPVLSIAPHYRCSRCNSKDVDSRPVQEAGASFAATPEPEDFGGALGALQGLLQAVRGESRDADGVQDLMNDDLLDTMVEEPEEEDSPFERAMAALRGAAHDDEPEDELGDEPEDGGPPHGDDDRRTAEVDAFDELLAKLAPARSYHDEGEDEPKPTPEPPPYKPRDAAPADSSLDETLAALRALTFAAEPDAEEEDDDDLRDGEADDVPEDLPEDLDDIPDEEIVSFAIRDPDARAEPEPDLDLDADEEEEDPVPFRRPSPQPGSLDESLAALRALVEKAAADEPEPSRARDAAPDRDRDAEWDEDREPEEPEDDEPPPLDLTDTVADEDEPKDDRPPLKTAQEKSLEETLAQLRGMLDLDKPADEGEPVIKPRRR